MLEDYVFEFLRLIVGGGYLDWEKLAKYCEEYEVDPKYVVETIEEFKVGNVSFNDLMYGCLYLAVLHIKDRLIEVAKENGMNKEVIEKIQDYEVEIYTNYLDSFIDDPIFGSIDYKELKEDKNYALNIIKQIIK